MDLIQPDALAVIAIRLEGDIEPFEGKVAIASVIRNRMKFKYQSDGTVAGTVLHPAQFSAFNTHDPRRHLLFQAQIEHPKTMDAIMAWQKSGAESNVGRAVLYYAALAMVPPGSKPSWVAAARFYKQVGSQLFYEDPVLDSRP